MDRYDKEKLKLREEHIDKQREETMDEESLNKKKDRDGKGYYAYGDDLSAVELYSPGEP